MAFLLQTLIFVFTIVFAITIHEFSHAWAATKLGDPTAKKAGRLTLDPRKHIDPIGFIALMIVKIGWGKPVPINQYNLKKPGRDQALIAFAGPLSNLIAAALLSIPLNHLGAAMNPLVATVLEATIFINLVLMVFNLMPIPPLDGANIVFSLLPHRFARIEEVLRRNGPFILIGVIILDRLFLNYFQISIIGTVIGGSVNAIALLLKMAG